MLPLPFPSPKGLKKLIKLKLMLFQDDDNLQEDQSELNDDAGYEEEGENQEDEFGEEEEDSYGDEDKEE
jgi:hypothetical protein